MGDIRIGQEKEGERLGSFEEVRHPRMITMAVPSSTPTTVRRVIEFFSKVQEPKGGDIESLLENQATETDGTPVDGDTFYSDALSELFQVAPEVVLDLGLESLSRTCELMEEMVEETRADLEKIEAQRIEIDRQQAETRAIFKEVIEQMERLK
jgi:hypothetical protein